MHRIKQVSSGGKVGRGRSHFKGLFWGLATALYTDAFLLRERLEAVCEVGQRLLAAILHQLLLLLLTVAGLLDADVIDHVVSTTSRESAQNNRPRFILTQWP